MCRENADHHQQSASFSSKQQHNRTQRLKMPSQKGAAHPTRTINPTPTMSHPAATEPFYELVGTFKPINLLLTAVFIVFAVYKMLTHPGGAARGLNAAFDAVVWLLVGIVGFVVELAMGLLRAVYGDLTMLA
jgi:hypothetical protein